MDRRAQRRPTPGRPRGAEGFAAGDQTGPMEAEARHCLGLLPPDTPVLFVIGDHDARIRPDGPAVGAHDREWFAVSELRVPERRPALARVGGSR